MSDCKIKIINKIYEIYIYLFIKSFALRKMLKIVTETKKNLIKYKLECRQEFLLKVLVIIKIRFYESLCQSKNSVIFSK